MTIRCSSPCCRRSFILFVMWHAFACCLRTGGQRKVVQVLRSVRAAVARRFIVCQFMRFIVLR